MAATAAHLPRRAADADGAEEPLAKVKAHQATWRPCRIILCGYALDVRTRSLRVVLSLHMDRKMCDTLYCVVEQMPALRKVPY